MIEKVNQLLNSIENPIEFVQKASLLFAAFIIGNLLSWFIFNRICRFFCEEKTFNFLWKKLSPPSIWLGGLALVFILLPSIDLPTSIVTDYFLLALRALTCLSLLWWTLRLLDSIIMFIHWRLEAQEKPIPVALFFFGGIIKGILAVIFIIAIMPSFFFGYTFMNTVVKYVGVSTISAGAIAGLALQPTLRDISGGLLIITQGLFKEGEWIEFNVGRRLFSGRVMDVTLRYTKLKRWTGSFLTVFNNTFLTSVIDNFGRAHYAAYSLPLTTAQKGNLEVEQFLKDYRALIKDSPHIEEEKCHVTVKSLDVGKMEVELHIFFKKAPDQDKVLRIHKFWQNILKLAKNNKLAVISP